MKICSTYKVRLTERNLAFSNTVELYRRAVDFFIGVMRSRPDSISECSTGSQAVNRVERLTIPTAKRPEVPYDFSAKFYKFPCYLRRSAIAEAFGKYSSWVSNHRNWEENGRKGKVPGKPKAGFCFPAMYRDNTFVRTGTYTASIKAWIRNTWDWVDVTLRKCDVDYISKRCSNRKECVPTLCRRGKVWSLDFSFEEKVKLNDTKIQEQRIVAVDLGINNACTCSVMCSDGTVVGRKFLRLPAEYDCLNHRINRIKQAQQRGARRTPRLWGYADNVNRHIAELTARFISDIAMEYNADCVVFEALELKGKKRGSKKQRLHLWRARSVQSIVTGKVHRFGCRVSHVCAWNTSRLAFDGSGRILRGSESERTSNNYSLCEFSNGKLYHCDLNASYNIGARYYIRELLKSVPATRRLQLEAKVPSVCKRSTCVLSDLISLGAAMVA